MKPSAGVALCLLAAVSAFVCAQTRLPAQTQAQTASLQGHVRDSDGKPVADAVVSLQCVAAQQTTAEATTTAREAQTAHTDSEGAYHFSALREGAYVVCAETRTGERKAQSRVELKQSGTSTVDLVLALTAAPEAQVSPPSKARDNSPASAKGPEFFDEPQFTVAGITQATNSGGHGSDVVLRTSEALVKATGSLSAQLPSKESMGSESEAGESAGTGSVGTENLDRERAEIRAQIRGGDNLRDEQVRRQQAERYHQLAQLDEKAGDPLEAVREYQQAAELDPSEPHLFDWASELLTHRALEPATEVFAQGNRRFPQSARMLIGLGVAWYARDYERASQYLCTASDLAPADPTPYLFMGKMQSAETAPSKESVERLARFQRLAPENGLANYYYAVGLWKRKQAEGTLDEASSEEVKALLQRAIELDPKLGAAYLQLGIVYAQRGDYKRAISVYQKAIAASPELEEAHYRLAQAYRRTGKGAEAQKEMQLHEELAKKSKEDAERKRREIQEFVVSLRDK
jgi:tetratricopeptide (TPR) repeat protein